jgi:hypothetical protein
MPATPTIDAVDLAFYRHQGHRTVNGVFTPAEMDALVRDIEQWGESFLSGLPEAQRSWYVDGGVRARTVLRKLDNPHAHRDAVKALARDRRLVDLVERFLGPGVSVYFSDITTRKMAEEMLREGKKLKSPEPPAGTSGKSREIRAAQRSQS